MTEYYDDMESDEPFHAYNRETIPFGLAEEAMSTWLDEMLSKHPGSLLAEWCRVYDGMQEIYHSEEVPIDVSKKRIREWTGQMTTRHPGTMRHNWKSIIERAQVVSGTSSEFSALVPTGLNGLERDMWVESMMFKHPGFFTEKELYEKLDFAQASLEKSQADDVVVGGASTHKSRLEDSFDEFHYPDFDAFPLPVRLSLNAFDEVNQYLKVFLIKKANGIIYAHALPSNYCTKLDNGNLKLGNREYAIHEICRIGGGAWFNQFNQICQGWQRKNSFIKLKTPAGFQMKISYANFIKNCIRKEIKFHLDQLDRSKTFNPMLNVTRKSRADEQAQSRDLHTQLKFRTDNHKKVASAVEKIANERDVARFRTKRLAFYFTEVLANPADEIECPTVLSDVYDNFYYDLPFLPAGRRKFWATTMEMEHPGTTSKMWFHICSHFSPHESDPTPKRKLTSERAPLFRNSESQHDALMLEVVKPFKYEPPVDKEARDRENNVDLMKRLSQGIKRKMIAAPPAGCLDHLYVDFPNFEKIIDLVRDQLMLFARSKKMVPLHFDPIVILGNPGIGKTELLQSLARALTVPQITIDLASVTSSFLLSGISSSYSGSKAGIILSTLTDETEDSVANFMFIGDELDKLCGSSGSAGNHNGAAALFSLLESSSSCKFKDEFTDGKVPIDASMISFMFSANDVSMLSDALLSRLHVVTVDVPNYDQRIQITKSIWRMILEKNKKTWGPSFPAQLSESVIEKLSKSFESPREIKRAIMKSLASAASAGASEVECDHIVVTEAGGRRRMGF